MTHLPLNLHKWFEPLSDSIVALYAGKFKNPCTAQLDKNLNELLVANFTLWGYEDEARRTDLPDREIANLKRRIDKKNQKRNDLIDVIDAILKQDIKKRLGSIDKSVPLNSETPGSVFDRLTVLALRTYHLKKEVLRKDVGAPHRERCARMLKQVEGRSGDLLKCLEGLLDDYYSGRKRLKSYKQHKLYNDPALNPSLRK